LPLNPEEFTTFGEMQIKASTSNSSGSGTRVLALGRLHQFRKVAEGDFQRIAAVTLNALADPEPDVRVAASHAVSQFLAGIARPSLEEAITADV
jgi:hypothetical protein